jgi:hypothetical protein
VSDAKKKKKRSQAGAARAAVDKAPAVKAAPQPAEEKAPAKVVAPVKQPVKAEEKPHKAAPPPESPAEEQGDVFALMGYFKTPGELYHACEELRDAGFKRFDAHTPFPVHGLEKAMGLPPTKFAYLPLVGGVAGLTGAISLAYYTQAVDYPQNISGKMPFSYQAYIPIFFELTVLLAGLTCFFGLWAWLRLPSPYHAAFTHPSFHRCSDDAFFIAVEADDPKYDSEKTKAMLEKLGALELEEVRS